jgi:NAD(P)-dependent dehydrogenase (short-subunit alcohol dehydrogenase family)
MARDVFSVEGRAILVTGAAGLIGSRACRTFLERGARVVAAGHDPAKVSALEAALAASFPRDRFLATSVELADPESSARCVRACVDRFGRLDVLVANAAVDAKFDPAHVGGLDTGRFENYPFEKLRRSVDVNVLGTIAMDQAACRQMLAQGGGVLLHVASSYSVVAPNPALYDTGSGETRHKPADYVATKSFLPNFTRYLAVAYAPHAIRCNALAPHGVFQGHDEAFLRNFARLSPMGRMARVEELDGPFLFLASDASSYVTGITLLVDGGWAAW